MHVLLVDAAVTQALHDGAHGITEVSHAKLSKRALDNEQSSRCPRKSNSLVACQVFAVMLALEALDAEVHDAVVKSSPPRCLSPAVANSKDAIFNG